MFDRKTPVIVALALAGALSAGAAQAGVHWNVNIGIPVPVYAEPAYYAPPPVYYAPPPVYYAPPPPVYYQPRPVVVYRNGPPAIVGGSWERHRRDRDWRDDRGPGRGHPDRGHHHHDRDGRW